MARPKEFDQEKALRKAIRLFCQQGLAAVPRQASGAMSENRLYVICALEILATDGVSAGF